MNSRRLACLSFLLAAGFAIPSHAQTPAVTRSLFDPDGVALVNGGNDLVLATGDTLAIDTSALTITRNGTSLGTGVLGTTGGASPQTVALFAFKNLTIPGGVTLTVTGTQPLGLLARENMSIGSALSVSAASAAGDLPGPGGAEGGTGGGSGAGGSGAGPGGGGGATNASGEGGGGGHGGVGEGSSLAGPVYGDSALSDLRGGSGGGGGRGYVDGFNSFPGKKGGSGGGAVLLLAQNTLQITAAVTAKGNAGISGNPNLGSGGGGSGGAIVLAAPHVSVSGTTLNADGGPGGYFTSPGFEGGFDGGGGRIATYSISAPPSASAFQARRPNVIFTGGFPPTQTTYAASGSIFRSTVDEPAFLYPPALILQPQISGMSATGVTQSTATLNAQIRPGAIPATAVFEYGLTTAYGSTMTVPLSPDSGTALQTVSAAVTGLQPLTLYHYRLKATNSSGPTLGADATFFTPGSPVFNSASDLPVTLNGFNATGLTMTPVLNFAPAAGTVITLVNNTSASPITGELANIADKGTVVIMHNGIAHTFVASYSGGDGNDLMLILPGPGVLDYTFGKAGWATASPGASVSGVSGMVLGSDGRIIVAGYHSNTNADFALGQFTVEGSLDASFGTGGTVTTAVGSAADYGTGVALQADGKIVVAGYSSNGSNDDFAVVRYNANGSLDSGMAGDSTPADSFGTGGKVITPIGTGTDQAQCVVIQSDGKIILAGQALFSNADFALVRYNADGSLDSGLAGDTTPGDSFGTGGKVTLPIGSSADAVESIALQSDGKILVAGQALIGTNEDIALARFNTNGSLDSTFGTGGKVTTPVGTSDDFGNSVVLQSDGRILVAGQTRDGSNRDFALLRYTSTGALDGTFGTGGKVITAIGTSIDVATSAAVQSDGKIIVAGISNVGSTQRVALVRYQSNGSLDTGFGAGGKSVAQFNSETAGVDALALQGNGMILTAGYVQTGGAPKMAVARFEAGLHPEIGVELTGLGTLADAGHTVDYGLAFPGTPTSRTFTIRNTGFSDLTGLGISFSGAAADDFSVGISPVAPVAGPTGNTVFTVTFNPATAGVKNAVMHIASNDGNEASFEVALTGRALAPEADDDGDGLNNAAEVTLAGAGFDPLVDSAALVATLRNSGLYRATDLQALALGRPVLERSATTGNLHLNLGVKKSPDLLNWTPLTGFTPTYDPLTGTIALEIVPDSSAVQFFQVFGAEP